MDQRSFQDFSNEPDLVDGTEVTVRIGDSSFKGKIVGKSAIGMMPYYIVECLDKTFPNEAYNYKVISMPMSEISVK